MLVKKNRAFLVLSLLSFASFSLCSCGPEETADQPTKSTSQPSARSTQLPTQPPAEPPDPPSPSLTSSPSLDPSPPVTPDLDLEVSRNEVVYITRDWPWNIRQRKVDYADSKRCLTDAGSPLLSTPNSTSSPTSLQEMAVVIDRLETHTIIQLLPTLERLSIYTSAIGIRVCLYPIAKNPDLIEPLSRNPNLVFVIFLGSLGLHLQELPNFQSKQIKRVALLIEEDTGENEFDWRKPFEQSSPKFFILKPGPLVGSQIFLSNNILADLKEDYLVRIIQFQKKFMDSLPDRQTLVPSGTYNADTWRQPRDRIELGWH